MRELHTKYSLIIISSYAEAHLGNHLIPNNQPLVSRFQSLTYIHRHTPPTLRTLIPTARHPNHASAPYDPPSQPAHTSAAPHYCCPRLPSPTSRSAAAAPSALSSRRSLLCLVVVVWVRLRSSACVDCANQAPALRRRSRALLSRVCSHSHAPGTSRLCTRRGGARGGIRACTGGC